MTRVLIIESEKGWGQKVDAVMDFDSYDEAENYVRDYNRANNPEGPTPDWYMYARIEGDTSFGMKR